MERKFAEVCRQLKPREKRLFLQELEEMKLNNNLRKKEYFFAAIQQRKIQLVQLFLRKIDYVNFLDEEENKMNTFVRKLLDSNRDGKTGRIQLLDCILHYGDRLSKDVAGFIYIYRAAQYSDERNQLEKFIIQPVMYYHKIIEIGTGDREHLWLSRIIERLHPEIDFNIQREKYKNELQRLDATVLGNYPRYSLKDFLTCNKFTFSKYHRNKNFNNICKETGNNFEEKFPEYGKILNYIYMTTKRRYIVSEIAKLQLNNALGIELDEYFAEKNLGNLSESDLKTMSYIKK